MTTRYRQSWHVLNEQTFAFDYDFTLSMPDYKITGDGDSFKEYEGTIKASGKDMADAKKKAEKELMRRIDSAEKATKGSLEDNISSILQTGKAVSEGLKEFTLVHVVRYRDPLNKKRFAVPFKTKEKAQAKMDQLKRDGVKEIEITQDTLRGNIKFKEVNEEKFEVTGEVDYFGAPNPKDFEVTVSAKDAAEAKQKVMDKYQKGKKRVSSVGISSVQKVNEEKKDLKATKEFEKDLAAEADLTKGQIKKVHKMADELPKKDFKDRYGKEKGDSVRYATATNIVKKKEGIKEMQQIDEKIEGLKNKSEKSGIPYGILKQVYNRGMAAWKGGHRPGTTPQQWAFARVNAFITKGKAYYTADADLAKKARAAKKGKK